MNRTLSVKEVVALFEKFMGSLADDELEKIVGKPTKKRVRHRHRCRFTIPIIKDFGTINAKNSFICKCGKEKP